MPGNVGRLTVERFFKSSIPLVLNFWCGDADYATEATEWIHGRGTPSVRTVLNKQGQVWLYRNGLAEVVGFGSLTTETWDNNGEPFQIQYIPMLGVFTDFQGRPDPSTGEPKYCYQIVDHLIDQAELRRAQLRWLGLSVRPENAKAIHIYEKVGFRWLKQSDGWSRMVLDLAEG